MNRIKNEIWLWPKLTKLKFLHFINTYMNIIDEVLLNNQTINKADYRAKLESLIDLSIPTWIQTN